MNIPPHRWRLMSPSEREVAEASESLYRSLGEFFLLWADVELEIYRVLIHYAGVTDDVGRALFSGARARNMIDFVKNIAHNTGMDAALYADLEYLFAQANAINTMRDRIAHNGSALNTSFSHVTKQRWLSNYHRVGKKGQEFNDGINADIVEAMSVDLRRCQYRLSLHHRKDAPTTVGQDIPRDGGSWRYTAAQPRSPKNMSRGTQGPRHTIRENLR